jgi:integrase
MACIVKRRGRYVIDFYDQRGKRRWKTLPEGTNKKDAREELAAIEKMVGKGTYIAPGKAPLFSKVAEDWLEYKKLKIRITTWEVCDGHVRNHFKDLDGLRIDRITTPVIEMYITTRQQQGMNINTLRKVLVTLGQILSYAVRHKYLDHNPLKEAERPRDLRVDEKEVRVLTPEQIRALLGAVEDQKYLTLFLMAVMTGARQGELLGLKWDDLDLGEKQVHIQRTFNNGRFFPTKTKGSRRKIDLSPALLIQLRKWKLACPKAELDLVFPSGTGQPINHRNMVQRHFEPALEKAEIPKIRFHNLRHTYASLLIEQGENLKYIQTQLGHSSPTVTLNVYTHLLKPTNQEAVQRLENAIFAGSGSKMVAETKKDLTANG